MKCIIEYGLHDSHLEKCSLGVWSYNLMFNEIHWKYFNSFYDGFQDGGRKIKHTWNPVVTNL